MTEMAKGRVGSISLPQAVEVEDYSDVWGQEGARFRLLPGTYEVLSDQLNSKYARVAAINLGDGNEDLYTVGFGLNATCSALISSDLPGLEVELDDDVRIVSFQMSPGRTAYRVERIGK